ncbi:hypothetical protein [Helicobacter trogontum]|uniref:hypothetical protein n=1 Tax=Helicobacter trogontum TaxID=50960 RepID=UPI000AF65976|nr:hypothetical protein [Helicobacter trogontum]
MKKNISSQIKKRYGTIKTYSIKKKLNYSTLRFFICKYPKADMPRYEKALREDGFIR